MTKILNKSLFKILIISIFSFSNIIFGQESLELVSYNPKIKTVKTSLKSLVSIPDTLPFFDDFAYASDSVFYPGHDWIDKNVFINNNYCINPVSIGVATFDALDKSGKIYEKAQNTQNSDADTLTSRMINLKKYSVADSVYLSFYYQATGYGEKPEPKDSLLIQFFSSKIKAWKTIYFIPGQEADDTIQPFKQVMIKIDDTIWFDSIFQFRFVNKASINITNNAPGMNTNGDIWNVDYVYMNANRSIDDTTYNDVAVVAPVKAFLKKFSSMPWKHYLDYSFKEIGDKFYLKIYNHHSNDEQVNDHIVIRDVYGGYDFEPIELFQAAPYLFSTFEEYCQVLKSDEPDSALFKVTASVGYLSDKRKGNNTVVSYQNFNNYYAYDDGSAEYGYGLRGDNITGATVAYKIDGYRSDTLVAVKIYFNRSVGSENITKFDLMVWDEKNGKPGDSIAGKVNCEVKIDSTEGNCNFITYTLDTPKVVPAIFYVGWQQKNEVFLNVGYDRNNVATDYIYYNTEGTTWVQSKLQKKGALMIRPIYGKSIQTKQQVVKYDIVETYPNPALSCVKFNFDESVLLQSPIVTVLDITGNMRIKKRLVTNNLNIESLHPGIYFVIIQTSEGKVFNSKLIKQ